MGEARTAGCKVDGCTNPHRSLGYCNVHYQRVHRLGTIHLPPSGFGNGRDTPKPKVTANTTKPRPPSGDVVGTITLEEWRRRQHQPVAAVHFVRFSTGTGDDAA